MNPDPAVPSLSTDARGRIYRQVGTSRVYLDGQRVGMGYPVAAPHGEHSSYSTPVPSRDDMAPEFRALLSRPWVEPRRTP